MNGELKLPKRVLRIIEACERGQTLCRQFSPLVGRDLFHFEPSGREAPNISAWEAIRSGELVASLDGFFAATFSQTWKHKKSVSGMRGGGAGDA